MSDRDSNLSSIRIERSGNTDDAFKARLVLDQLLGHLDSQEKIDADIDSLHLNPMIAEGFKTWFKQCTSREAAEHMLLHNPFFMAWVGTRQAAQWMWEKGDPKGHPDPIVELNHHLYTHNEDGSLNRVKSGDVRQWFEPGKEEEWPQLMLTTNHADTSCSDRVSGIMNNFCALFKRALPPGKFELERHPDRAKSVKGKTIMLSAIHAEESWGRNGADLMFRNIYLREHASLADRVCPPMKEDEQVDVLEAEHRGPSPAAIRLAKLMLKLMAEDPAQVDVDETRTLRDMAIDAGGRGEPLVLRADAEAIAKHITLMGYSKGANTINDAVRYLGFELSAVQPDGKALVARRQQDGGLQEHTTLRDANPIMRKLGLIGVNGPGVKLTDEERELGIYRLRLRNHYDLIAGHFDSNNGTTETVDQHDVIHTVQGSRHRFGHDENHALGIDKVAGYIFKDPVAMDLIGKVVNRKYGVELPEQPAQRVGAAR